MVSHTWSVNRLLIPRPSSQTPLLGSSLWSCFYIARPLYINGVFAVQRRAIGSLSFLSNTLRKKPIQNRKVNVGRLEFQCALNLDEHLSGSQHLGGILRPLDPTAWLYLFREGKGAEAAKAHCRTLTSIYKVKDIPDV